MRRLRRAGLLSLLAVAVPVLGDGPVSSASAGSSSRTQVSVVRAPKWDALFDRRSGWTGADGIYSMPVAGVETPGSVGPGKTFFVFSDTFVGEVNDAGQRQAGTTMVNNTMAVLTGGVPDPRRMKFFVRTDSDGKPTAQVIPNTSPEHWFWPNDGIVIGNAGYLFSLRMEPGSGGVFDFAVDGISLLTTSGATAPPFAQYDQVDAPLFLPADDERGEVFFGQAVMPNTVAAGAPAPDGYLYVYGLQNDLSKQLVAARVMPEQIADFSAYRFWDGSTWSTEITQAAPLTSRMSSEFSVTPLADGRYILVFQLDGLSSKIAVRYGSSPVGPWSAPTVIWTAPEDTMTPNTFVYNAKAHPHLSRPGELLISYNVNTFAFAEHFSNADIYRPRFIRLRLS